MDLDLAMSIVMEFVSSHPILICMVLFMVYNKYKASQPWPDYGGNLTKVSSVEQWESLMQSSAAAEQLVVVDCYATWCGPCKTAAPVYAKLSTEFSTNSICFAKLDVDDARALAAKLEISAMPTFKVFKAGAEVDSSRGWPGEAALAKMLVGHGAKQETSGGKKAD